MSVEVPPAVVRWAWLLILAVGTACYLVVLQALRATDNLNLLPSLLVLGSVVVPASALTFVAARRPRSAPVSVLVAVAIVGGVFGTAAAAVVEYDVLQGLGALPMLAVGLIEESVKLIAPLIVLLVSRHRWPDAGIAIGVASGMGFASLETMGYGLHALLSTGSIADVDQTLLLRGLVSPACHIAWTGVSVAAIWRIPFSERPERSVATAVATFLAVVGLHAVWDGSNNVVVHVATALVSLAGLLITSRQDISGLLSQSTQLGPRVTGQFGPGCGLRRG